MTLAATDTALVWAGFDGQKHAVDCTRWRASSAHPLLRMAREQLQQYFAGERQSFDIALGLDSGTAFQNAVWRALCEIPVQQTWSYGQLARHLGRAQAQRAVGAAVGRNPVSIIVPCHRVLGAHGALTGYAGGLERKVALLQHEGILL